MASDTLKIRKLDRAKLLEDAGLPKGRVKAVYANYSIAASHYDNVPQAVIKVTSYLSGTNKTNDHHQYIARNGDIELETETGEIINGKDDIRDLIDEWRVDFSRKHSDSLQSYKITIKNTDPDLTDDLYKKAKQYAKEYFPNNKYRIDKGTYKNNKETIFISVKQINQSESLPVLEDIQDRFNLLYDKQEIDVSLKEKQLNRDVVNIMFSSPEGSDPEAVLKSVRSTAKTYFSDTGYRYVFALHTDTNNPHVHLSVKMVNEMTGKKLQLNPKELMQLKELYVEKSKNNGIIMSNSSRYKRGKGISRKSIKEIKLTQKEKIKGNNILKHKQLVSSIKESVKHRKNPVFKSLMDYRKRFKTKDEFINEAKLLKDKSFKENDNRKKVYLIQLYKALINESDTMANSKVQTLNESTRNEYKQDANLLIEHANKSDDKAIKTELLSMADTLNSYSKDMPKAITPRDRLLQVVVDLKAKEDLKQADKSQGMDSNNRDNDLEKD